MERRLSRWRPLAAQEPDLARPGLARLRPERRLPPYRYLPGVQPHPTQDREGHSYRDGVEPEVPAWEPGDWQALEDYLFGVDLYNHHYYWEAHEAWEGLWQAAVRDSRPFRYLQGLIQVAAALLKLRLAGLEPHPDPHLQGCRRLAGRGLGLLEGLAGELGASGLAGEAVTGCYMGLELPAFIDRTGRFLAPVVAGGSRKVDQGVPLMVLDLRCR